MAQPLLEWRCPSCADIFDVAIPGFLELSKTKMCYDCTVDGAIDFDPTWECTVCFEEYKWSAERPRAVVRDSACIACLERRFDMAIKSEHDYPVIWQGQKIRPEDYGVSAECIAAFHAREKEYKTPMPNRIYCSCENFVGVLTPMLTFEPPQRHDCSNCSKTHCLRCGSEPSEPGFGKASNTDATWHIECNEAFRDRMLSQSQGVAGLKKGVDYQVCPGCGRRIELARDCNHMSCPCGVQFCYLCGKNVSGDDEHFFHGGCPRYNAAGSGQEQYDDDPEEEEDENADIEAVRVNLPLPPPNDQQNNNAGARFQPVAQLLLSYAGFGPEVNFYIRWSPIEREEQLYTRVYRDWHHASAIWVQTLQDCGLTEDSVSRGLMVNQLDGTRLEHRQFAMSLLRDLQWAENPHRRIILYLTWTTESSEHDVNRLLEWHTTFDQDRTPWTLFSLERFDRYMRGEFELQ